MGDGTEKNPYTREDVLRLIKENGGTAEGLDLSDKKFEEGIDLSKLDLRGIIIKDILIGAHLEGANLVAAHVNGILKDAHFEGACLVFTHFEAAFLGITHFEGADLSSAHLERADLTGAHLEGAYLKGAEFSPETRLEEADWGSYILGEENDKDFDSAETIYRRLKQWYTNIGIYDMAGEFYYREMEAKRKAQSWKKEPLSKLWSWVIRLLCGYGERYGNVVVAALVIIFGLAVVYVYGGLNVAYAIYFSAVSFTALGYGNWVNVTPEGWVQALGAVESFLGVFTMALFLITFVRKMTR